MVTYIYRERNSLKVIKMNWTRCPLSVGSSATYVSAKKYGHCLQASTPHAGSSVAPPIASSIDFARLKCVKSIELMLASMEPAAASAERHK